MKKRTWKQAINSLECADLPMLLLIGMSLGFFVVGLTYLTIGILEEYSDGTMLGWRSILAGSASVGISTVIAGIVKLYWWLIPRKSGVIFPRINGFGVIGLVLAMFSGAMIGVELVLYLLMLLK